MLDEKIFLSFKYTFHKLVIFYTIHVCLLFKICIFYEIKINEDSLSS